MELLKNVISFSEAKRTLLTHLQPLERIERLRLSNAVHRVLARDIVAELHVPPFDRAAMDGYAVRSVDTEGAKPLEPVVLKKTGIVHAGEYPKISITPGTCVQIATGAVMPENSDAVVMIESTECNDEQVSIYSSVRKGENVTRAGEDIKKGSVVLKKGELLTPGKVSALAALGLEYVEVYALPEVALIPTGNEITKPGMKLEPGKIYDVNTYTLSALVSSAGALPFVYEITGDDEQAIEHVLGNALKHDIVVFTGGSSVGERDVLVNVLRKNGEVLYHGIAVKPGKPTLCAIVSGKVVLGMPGYPTSCLTNAYALLLPAIAKLMHVDFVIPEVRAKMGRRVQSTIGRLQFLPVKMDGEIALPAFKESGAITSMAHADGYIEIPENVDVVEKGEEVVVKLFWIARKTS